jgi:hypothetical protein
MAIERTYYCDAPDCEHHATTAARGRMAMSFLRVSGDGPAQHFCGWECVLKYAASKEPPEIIPWGPPEEAQ